jgi:hypothetical protein
MSIWFKPKAELDTVLDTKSASLNGSGEIEINGFNSASNNFIPYKKTDGTIAWKADVNSITLDGNSIGTSTASEMEVLGFEGAVENDFPYCNSTGSITWANVFTFLQVMPSLKIGDVAGGNYCEIKVNGSIKLHGTAVIEQP